MSSRVRPAHALLGAILLLAAAPSFAADVEVPRADLTKPHRLPANPRCAQPSAVAVIAVHVNELGKPFGMQTEKSSGCEALDRAGIDAIRNWRFVPATRDGEAVAEWTAIGFRFDGQTVSEVTVSPDTEVARNERGRIICKVDNPKTGSHINPAPVCLAKWQWEERKRQMDALRRHVRTPARIGTGGIAGAPH